ncbi:MAG: hypothetical protein WDA00_06585 [Eubacteriales bacterium]
MGKFSERLHRFFEGRYGFDQFYYFLLGVCVLLVIITGLSRHILPILCFAVLTLAVAFFAGYRLLSKNKGARQRENTLFLQTWRRFFAFLRLQKNRLRDRKTHVYKKCPYCRATLRLPRQPGDHTITCPRCKNPFPVHVK